MLVCSFSGIKFVIIILQFVFLQTRMLRAKMLGLHLAFSRDVSNMTYRRQSQGTWIQYVIGTVLVDTIFGPLLPG
ncbi:uncharacterized protein CC84DRAFT_744674 [Paraphaeosphaeria sporulosa]|uniref:Uncharacterized protein n=1 Tax=Paraphaeosphaeria sporulosa TaxID=1460663 RepID=A0A177CGJ2_9PLEO|nr:uncharacterized protein CC84DRAFT_744674 [Paraphaeosphaeria sporulosa]OAG06062.1 hypothetical protein CC84DRAFT_744674 [Paraphaeosphaeria sporulosa]